MKQIIGVAVLLTVTVVVLAQTGERNIPTAEPLVPGQSRLVHVTNFPDPQNVAGTVSVDNFPATQNVAGTVDVGNLPAVQQVAGQVEVTNLDSFCSEPNYMVVQVTAQPINTSTCSQEPCTNWRSEPIDVAGWKWITAQAIVFQDGILTAYPIMDIRFRNFSTDPFGARRTAVLAESAPVIGIEAEIQTDYLRYELSHISVYLSR